MHFFLYLSLISLFFLTVLSSFNNPKCKGARYLCSSENNPQICVNRSDSRLKVHLLQSCESGTVCPFSSNYTKNTISCINSTVIKKTLPGEYCSNNQDCYGVKCIAGVCKGNLIEESCTDHSDCEPGSFCNVNHTCMEQVAFGKNCSSSYECTNNCACSLGKCAYYYSLSNGIPSNNTETCASGYLVNNSCSESRHSLFAGSPCSSDSECALLNSSGNVVGYSECSCGYNGGGYSYCALSEGDQEFINIMNTFQYILLRSFNCHTLLRFGPCKYIYNDEYMDYQRALKKYEMYPKLVFNDPCIKKIFTSEYWTLFSGEIGAKIIVILLIFVEFCLL